MGGIHYVTMKPSNNDFAAGYNMPYR